MTALLTSVITADMVRGAAELTATGRGQLVHRLPEPARRQADQQVLAAESCPAGVRLALRTSARVVEIDAHRTVTTFRGMPPRPDGSYDLFVDGVLVDRQPSVGGRTVIVDLADGGVETVDGPVGTIRFADLPPGDKQLEIWLPFQEPIELIALRADAPIGAAPLSGRPTWVHHGSSISQGSNAASPSSTWPALAATAGGVELVNLGLSGSMMLDPFVARTIRDASADLISLEIGINIVGGDVMRRRVFGPAVHGFLDTVRDGHPTAPLVVMSPILCPIHEDTPGPGAPDFADGVVRFRALGDPAEVAPGPIGKLSLRAVRDELRDIVAARSDDANLHLLDGLSLYGEKDAVTMPLPDRLHPDPATHRVMAERFATQVFGAGGAFSR